MHDTDLDEIHLEVDWDGLSATISDNGSANGTTVNGNPVQTWQVADGDVIGVGLSALIFRVH